jgi:hypothetical protein
VRASFIHSSGPASLVLVPVLILAPETDAGVIGLMATTRLQADGNYLVNVFAVASDPSDRIVSVSGGQTGSITTTAAGGFRQGTGAGQGVWRPVLNQGWDTLDSFMTVGGYLDAASGAWTANTAIAGHDGTRGDPNWNVTYLDTAAGASVTVNAFDTSSNSTGFNNPFLNSVPAAGGWFSVPESSPPVAGLARNLSSLASLTRQYFGAASEANSTFGMMIAQFYASGITATGQAATISFRDMRVFFGQPIPNDRFFGDFVIAIPAPSAIALLGIASLAGGRRRTA